MIHPTRIQSLNKNQRLEKGAYVIYWMHASQRTEYNHALEYAISLANDYDCPAIVYFELIDDFPSANARHYQFALEGIPEIIEALEKRGIRFVCHYAGKKGTKDLLALSKKARCIVTDVGYLRFQRDWRDRYAKAVDCPFYAVETNVVIPVEVVSDKEEYAARTIRKKVTSTLSEYMVPLPHQKPRHSSLNLSFASFDLTDTKKAITQLSLDWTVSPVSTFHGGTKEAKKQLSHFVTHALVDYDDTRNDPTAKTLSNMSPYLHFGQISPLYIALQLQKQKTKAVDVYLEELIVRRELAVNYVHFNKQYDSYAGLPVWAKETLKKHSGDTREYIYTKKQFEDATTHDPYWNAAQLEMVKTGKMHGYMRMYWGKKILEWSKTPKAAFDLALYLNDKYELDGRDPNGYTGVAWCFGKHDRPWFERGVYGTVRYMNANGLKRKFNVEAYVKWVDAL